MKELEKKFSKSERIVAKARFSYWVFLQEILLAAVLGGLLAVVWIFAQQIEGFFTKDSTAVHYLTEQNLKWALLGCSAFVLICLALHALCVFRKELIMTEDKLIYKFGVLSVRSIMIPLEEVKIIESGQNALQRLMGYGNISIISDAEKPYRIKHIVRPERFARRVVKQISLLKNRNSYRSMRLQLAPQKNKGK